MTAADSKKLGWMIFLAAVFVYFGALWHRPLFAPDEVRYALIPREMLQSGNFAVPTLNGLTYFEKPSPAYWLTAGMMKLLGPTPFAVRLPSALFTLLTAGAVYLLGTRADSRKTGITAALLYLCSGLVFAVGTYAVLDAPFVFCVTAATALGYIYFTEKSLLRSLFLLLAAGIFLGAGTMIKGLLAPLLTGLAMTGFLFWKKAFSKWFLALLPVLCGMALAAVPCVLFVHRHAPAFWKEFILTEHLSRAFSGQGAADDRAQPFWYYIPVFAGTFLPVLFLALPGLASVRKNWKDFFLKDDFNFFCAITLVLWFIFFSAVSAKLGTYILPLFPFAALLTARTLKGGEDPETVRKISRLFRLLLPVLGSSIVLFIIWHLLPVVPGRWKLYTPSELLPAGMTGALLLLWYGMAAKEQDIFPERKFFYFCLGTGVVMLSIHHIMPQKIVRQHNSPAFIRRAVLPRLRPGAVILADGKMASSAAWVLNRDVHVYSRPGELAPGLARAGKKAVSPQDLKKMIPDTLARGGQLVIIVNSPARLKDMPPYAGKTVTRSGRMAAVFYGENSQ